LTKEETKKIVSLEKELMQKSN
jgi:hypothetical protein